VLFEECGRAAVPGPMFASIALGALPLLDFGNDQQKKSLLPGVASGELILTAAIAEPEVNEDARFAKARASRIGDRFAVSGQKLFVPYANVADHMLVVTRTRGFPGDADGITILLAGARAAGMDIVPLVTIAADKQFEVAFKDVSVPSDGVIGTLHEGLPAVAAALRKATALQCAVMVGGAQQELEMTAAHTKTRVQFGRPIGAFQAAQHRLADMFIDVNGTRWTTYNAIWRLSRGLGAEREVAVAKAFANIACQRVALSAQQLHGGTGVDVAYDLHFYFRRMKALELSLGSTPFHLGALEAEMSL
jgi:alkylation response protein AidB-like acyl-CoA dehydrogenase